MFHFSDFFFSSDTGYFESLRLSCRRLESSVSFPAALLLHSSISYTHPQLRDVVQVFLVAPSSTEDYCTPEKYIARSKYTTG